MKKYFDFKHLLIRLAVLVAVPALTITIVAIIAEMNPPTLDGHNRGNPMMGVAILTFLEITLMGIALFVETLWLHFRKQTRKRNSNLLIVGVAILGWLWFYLMMY